MKNGEALQLTGRWFWERLDPHGLILGRGIFDNGICTAALNDALSVLFRSSTQRTNWYAGLISSTSYTGVAADDTMSSHAGWTELTTYSESVRQTWTAGSPSAGVTINAAAMSFTFSAASTIKGAFIASDNTKGGTSGMLWSTGLFAESDQAFSASEVLKLYYQLTAAPGADS